MYKTIPKKVEAPAHKKLRNFRLSPNLAHRKLIDLANYVPGSRDSRNDFWKTDWKNGGRCGTNKLAAFAKNERL